jgi:hypothetical protein
MGRLSAFARPCGHGGHRLVCHRVAGFGAIEETWRGEEAYTQMGVIAFHCIKSPPSMNDDGALHRFRCSCHGFSLFSPAEPKNDPSKYDNADAYKYERL